MASTSVGNLAVQLSLNTQQFRGEITRTEREMNRFRSAMAKEMKVDFGDIRKGVMAGEMSRLGHARQMGSVYSGLGLAKGKMDAGEMAAQRALAGLQSSTLPRSGSEAMHGVRSMSSREASGATAEMSLAKQAQGLEKIGKLFAGVGFAMDGLKIGTALWKGEIDKAAEGLESLPLGIGFLVKGVKELREEWGLMPKYVGENKKQIDETAKSMERVKTASALFVKARSGFKSTAEGATQRAWEASLGTGTDADIARERSSRDQQVKDIREQLRTAVGEQERTGGGNAAGNITRLKSEAAKAEAAITAESNAKIAQLNQDRRYAQIESDNAEIMQARGSRVEIESMKLELEGKTGEAERLRILENGKLAAQSERDAGRFRLAAVAEQNAEVQSKLLDKRDRERVLGAQAGMKATAKDMIGDTLGAEHERIAERTRQQILAAGGNKTLEKFAQAQGIVDTAMATRKYNQSIVSGQNLSMMSAFSSPNIAVSGKRQREDAARQTPELIKLSNELLQQIAESLREDHGVPVSNN